MFVQVRRARVNLQITFIQRVQLIKDKVALKINERNTVPGHTDENLKQNIFLSLPARR